MSFLQIKPEFDYFTGIFHVVLKKSQDFISIKFSPYVSGVVIYNSGFEISSNISDYLRRCHKVFEKSSKKNVETSLEGC